MIFPVGTRVLTPAGLGVVVAYVVLGAGESQFPVGEDPLHVVAVGGTQKDYRGSRLKPSRVGVATPVSRAPALSDEEARRMAVLYGTDTVRREQRRRLAGLHARQTQVMLTCNVCGGRLNKRTGDCTQCEG